MIYKYIDWTELMNEEFLFMSAEDIINCFDWLSDDDINLVKVFLDELNNCEIEIMPSECTLTIARNRELEYSVFYGCEEFYASESNDTTGHNYVLVFSGDDFELTSIAYEGF